MGTDKVTNWKRQWIIIGDLVACTECGAPQFIMQREDYFVHRAY